MICSQIEEHQIKPHEICEISFQFYRCRCKPFDFNKWEALGPAENKPIDYCDGIAGFHLKDIAEDIRPHVKALSEIKQNLCDPKKFNEAKEARQILEPAETVYER